MNMEHAPKTCAVNWSEWHLEDIYFEYTVNSGNISIG